MGSKINLVCLLDTRWVVIQKTKSWDDARATCALMGRDLVSFRSDDELAELDDELAEMENWLKYELRTEEDLWIGLRSKDNTVRKRACVLCVNLSRIVILATDSS